MRRKNIIKEKKQKIWILCKFYNKEKQTTDNKNKAIIQR